MKHPMKCFVLLMCAVVLQSTLTARAQDNINPRAKEDLNAFIKKVEEGHALFHQKKYAEAIAPLAAANALYLRAERRDDSAGDFIITIKPQSLPAMRYYGYLTGPEGSLKGEMAEPLEERARFLNKAAINMWQDASILSDAAQVPNAFHSDPSLSEMTEEKLGSIVHTLYSAVSIFQLPVGDHQWRDVVLKSRRAKLILEHALQKYPAWKSDENRQSDKTLADINAKLAEAEPEYQKLVADFNKAEPAGFGEAMSRYLAELNTAIAGVKRNGWLDWGLARDVFITKDHLSDIRKGFVALYKKDGKTMPADKLKPLENKIAELRSAIDKTAPRWKFPAGKPHNAVIEASVKSQIKGRFRGVTIYKTALDGTNWTIQKNDIGLPRYRERDVLALVKLPGQKWPWLISGSFHQNYAGGGTFNSGGTFSLGANYAYARMQTAK